LLHDIGVSTTREKVSLADLEISREKTSPHCIRGYELLRETTLFKPLSEIVLYHHDFYRDDLFPESAIIHLADRIEIMLKRTEYCLWQVDDICHFVSAQRGEMFMPSVVDAFFEIAPIPRLWLDLESGNYKDTLLRCDGQRELSLDDFEEIARLFAHIVDDKSPYTAEHSRGVAQMAVFLCERLGMDIDKLRLMSSAGLLHDLGKLAVPESILLFPGRLDSKQMAIMKQHTYFTYHLIGAIGKGVENVQRWAAFHHEKLDGSGYPFAINEAGLDLESRIMAVADITQALTEQRPHRNSLGRQKVEKILVAAVATGHLDKELVDLALSYYPELTAHHQIA